MSIGALRKVAAGTGIYRQRQAAAARRVVTIEHIADGVVHLRRRPHPYAEGKIVGAKTKRVASRHLDISTCSVERAVVKDDTMIDAVVSVARVVQTIALHLPVADESRLYAIWWTIVRGSNGGT